jgi:dTDP-4-amino-4,6-dideoxygalactose transaminase
MNNKFQVNFNQNIYSEFSFSDKKTSGDGPFSNKVIQILEEQYRNSKLMLTTSCTHALEMTALLMDIKQGDEIIAPSFTFVSTVNAYVLRGAKIKFIDIRTDTLNIDENLILNAITPKTKAIVVVHYAGLSTEMDTIMEIANQHNLFVIEDAAQAINSKYKNRFLGSIGHFGTLSFHESKNISMGEGGALIINDSRFFDRAELIREKGTNRTRFNYGEVEKYTWMDIGSSYLPSDVLSAYLLPQLELLDCITAKRLSIWQKYYSILIRNNQNDFTLPYIPDSCSHNAHIFFIVLKKEEHRDQLLDHLEKHGIQALSHYVPLHSSPAGIKFSEFIGSDEITNFVANSLIRLPINYHITEKQVEYVCDKVFEFFGKQ